MLPSKPGAEIVVESAVEHEGPDAPSTGVFTNILCAVDGTHTSTAAVRMAAGLAGTGGHLTLLAVTAVSGSGRYATAAISPSRVNSLLSHAQRIAEDAGVSSTTVVDPGGPPVEVILERASDHDLLAIGAPARGGSMHLFDAAARFYGGNAIVGGGLPLAIGLALADKLQGRERATACFFGDGAVAEGEFHESMNLAAVWQLPVLFCCENNLYAMGTAIERYESETDLALKAASYEMPAWTVDGMDVLAVEDAARRAATEARGGRPCFLELRTYRFRAHSMYDPDLYRPKEEIERWKEHDPIPALAGRLQAAGLLSAGDVEEIEREVAEEIEAAIAFADAGTLEPVEDLARFVYWEPTHPEPTHPGTPP